MVYPEAVFLNHKEFIIYIFGSHIPVFYYVPSALTFATKTQQMKPNYRGINYSVQ